jgi:ribosomal protein L29
MKVYKMADLLKKDQKTLNEDLAKLKIELNEARVKATMRKASDDTSSQRKIRKQIARIQTALNAPVQAKEVKKEAKPTSAKKEGK